MGESVTSRILIDQANAVLSTLFSDADHPVSVKTVFREDILNALATLEARDHSAFVVIKEQLRNAKIPLRDLEKALKTHRKPLRLVRDDDALEPKTAGSYLDDAPCPEVIIPPPYLLSPEATLIMHQGPDPEQPPYEQTIAYAPILITGRLQSIDTTGQWLRLAWKRGDRWHHLDINRGVAMDARKLLELAGQGFPVATDNVANVARYLHELEAVNYPSLPTARMATRLGWQGEQGAYGFLCGRTLIRPDETVVIDDLSSVPGSQWQENWIVFHGDDDGDEQLVRGFRTRGTLEGWKTAIKPIATYPKVLFGFYASFAAPLLEWLHVPNFGIDWNGRTSKGKTTTLRVIASPWGCPDERLAGESVIHSWYQTPVWAERAAALLNGVPLMMDESKLAPKGLVSKVLYLVANGIGKGRGSRRGLALVKRWNTVLFSNGESPATGMSEDGGARMRCFSIGGYPFRANGEETLAVVTALNTELLLHYGHAGPLFVQWLAKHRHQLAAWQETHTAFKKRLIAKVTDAAAFRLADYAALIMVVAELVHKALDLPWEHGDPLPDDLWAALVHEASGAAGDVRALRHVLSWAQAHQEAFEGRHVRDAKDQSPKAPSGGWAGIWAYGEQGTIHFLPHVLDRVLEEGHFDPNAIKETWRENGWLLLETGRKTFVNRQRMFKELTRLVSLDLAIADPEMSA